MTVQTAFALRTPPEVNLMTLQPPNQFIDGLQNLMGVVEADNLRRDFTFNLKITRPDHPIEIKVGDLLAAVLPIPRGFVEKFELIDAYERLSPETVAFEQQTARDFGREREEVDSKNKRGGRASVFQGRRRLRSKIQIPTPAGAHTSRRASTQPQASWLTPVDAASLAPVIYASD